MNNTINEMTIVPITGQVISETTMGLDVPYIDAEEVFDDENHPNFIESNTQAITLEELTSKNIIPTFGDNTLTISHQSFIGAVTFVTTSRLKQIKKGVSKNTNSLILTYFKVIPKRFERLTHALEVGARKCLLSNENHYITYCLKFTLSKICHNM